MKDHAIALASTVFAVVLAAFACSSDDGRSSGDDGSQGGSLPSGYQVLADHDANGDGTLSADEAPADILSRFDQLDANDDGVLTPAEIDGANPSEAASSVIDTATQGASAAADTASAVSGEVCAEASATPTRMAPKVVLLLDGSGSMEEPYSDNESKWSAMRQAIVDPNDGVVSTMQALIEFGLVIYSGPRDSDDCPIPGEVVGPALNNYTPIAEAFPQDQPGGSTPTGLALQLVCEALPGVAVDQRPQYVILATDGEPNSCDRSGGRDEPPDYQSVVDAANFCCDKGVTLYVVSLASGRGSQDFQDHLQEVANIGACDGSAGAPVYSPQDPAQLSTDLGQLVGGAVTCDVLLDGSVVQGRECEGSVVTLNGRTLGCNDPDGWILVSENVIRLQGQACQEFTDNTDSVLTATFPCEVFVPGGGGPGEGGAGSGSGEAGSGSGSPGDLGPIF